MRVWVDDIQIESPEPGLCGAIAAARTFAGTSNRVVVEAELNGQTIADADLANPTTDPILGELRFHTADPTELVASTLRGVSAAMVDLKQDHAEAAELIQAGKVTDGMERLAKAFRSWDNVRMSVVTGCALLGIQVETLILRTNGPTVHIGQCIADLASTLGQVKLALQAQDWSALADLAGYDLQDQADRWTMALNALANHVQSQVAAI